MMKMISKANLLIMALSFVTLIVARVFFGSWMNILWWPLSLFLLSVVISFVIDFKSYWNFFTMKTARSGMNLGVSVLILIVILTSLAYLSYLFDRTYDFTENKIFSLSPQSLEVVNSMKDSGARILVFYKGKEAQPIKRQIEDILDLYEKNTDIEIEYIDAFRNNTKSQEYLSDLSDVSQQSIFVFVEYRSKRVRVEMPFQEEQILSAMINASRRVNKNVYFLSGHGEGDPDSSSSQGAGLFKKALEDSSFNVLDWNFIEQKKPLPDDSAVLVILGPKKIFFEQEIKWIKEYIENKGRVFIALDPGTSQNLAPLLKNSLGVDFKNNFIVSPLSKAFGRGEMSVFGVRYHSSSPITRSFQKDPSLFDTASELALSSEFNSEWTAHELVYSDPLSFTMESLKSKKDKAVQSSKLVALSVQEFVTKQAEKDDSDKKDEKNQKSKKDGFSAVIFGDSDFLTNRLFELGVHKDMALNAISYLADEDDLLNLRPRVPKGTKVLLHRTSQYIFVIFAILMPLVCFVLAGVSWFYRKKA